MNIITATELSELFSQNKILILDARHEDEYNGGHIKGAINIRTFEGFLNLFETYDGAADYVVTHCEFSVVRGPSLLSLIHEYDKFKNEKKPLFPKLYLLQDGYKNFYSKYPHLCDEGYISEAFTHVEKNQEQHRIREEMKSKIEKLIREGNQA
jgi:M-phase inducer tyrosine phosphatase